MGHPVGSEGASEARVIKPACPFIRCCCASPCRSRKIRYLSRISGAFSKYLSFLDLKLLLLILAVCPAILKAPCSLTQSDYPRSSRLQITASEGGRGAGVNASFPSKRGIIGGAGGNSGRGRNQSTDRERRRRSGKQHLFGSYGREARVFPTVKKSYLLIRNMPNCYFVGALPEYFI